MDQTQFAMWRFKTAEGVMDYIKKWDTNSCTLSIDNKNILITYNPSTEEAVIEQINSLFSTPVICSFDKFVETMTQLGYYKERIVNRHSLSKIKFTKV